MFSYYGSKSKIVHLYPKPVHNKIIEPFAGSARYSLKYFDKDITLIDKYEVLIKTWKWLQQCSPNDILSLPDLYTLKVGFDLRTLNLSEGELYFLGFNAAVASISPRFKLSKFCIEQNGMQTYFKRVAKNLYKIKHWKFINDSYENIHNESATWFIDPPYQFGGHAYFENKIDFGSLAYWCQNREGQVIVCENTKANWLPFKPVVNFSGAMTITTEAIWTNYHTQYNNEQQKLF